MQDSVKIWQDSSNKWHIQVNKNDSASFLFAIYDEDEALRDLSGSTTTLSIYEYLADLDTGVASAEISVDCVNSETTGYAEADLLASEIVLLSRKTYLFELKTVFTADSSVKSIIGVFHVV